MEPNGFANSSHNTAEFPNYGHCIIAVAVVIKLYFTTPSVLSCQFCNI